MEGFVQGIPLLFLFYGAAEDVKKASIPQLLPVFFGLAGLLRHLSGTPEPYLSLGGCLPGAFALLLAWISGQAVGYGDGIMLLCCGLFLSLPEALVLTFCALAFSGVAAACLLAGKRTAHGASLPFLPFLLAGYVAMLALGGTRY